ncbi:MAG: SRPBCC domain-containing protein [Actinomycetales bacterium]|nr:SRPBCC domain-containing protein [Actinomycetales bacterium]
MSVTSVAKDLEALTMTVTAEYDVSVDRAWQLWADPRQLERWWGPPTFPATFERHELEPDGVVTYYMTGPEGEVHRGWWKVLEVEPPRRLVVQDGFGDEPSNAAAGMPSVTMRVTLADRVDGGVVMTMLTAFPSLEAMEQMLQMGMEQGLTLAMGQIDRILAA